MEAYSGKERPRKLHNHLEERGKGVPLNFMPKKSTEKPPVLSGNISMYLMSMAATVRHDRMLSFTEGVSALLGVWI